MYDKVNAVEALIDALKPRILEDRQQFFPLFKLIEEFAAHNRLVTSGRASTQLITRPELVDVTKYEFYTENVFQLAKKLAIAVYNVDPKGLTRYTYVSTKLPNQLLSLVVDTRELVLFHQLASHRGVSMLSVIRPSRYPGLFTNNTLECIGPEIQLGEAYFNLMNPANEKKWPAMEMEVAQLEAFWKKEAARKLKMSGGGHSPSQSLKKLLTMIDRPYVHVGELALSEKHVNSRLQVITSAPLVEEDNALREIGRRANIEIQTTLNNLNFPPEPRLVRLTGNIIHPGNVKEPFIDVYNIGNFALVPHIKNIGTRPVQLLIQVLDFWTMQLLCKMKKVTPNYANQILNRTMNRWLEFTKWPHTKTLTYLGLLEDPFLATKRRLLEQKVRRYPPFYPVRIDQTAAAASASGSQSPPR